jgi:hypothetical protein
VLEIFNFRQSFSIRKYKKTHLHHYKIPRKKLKTHEEKEQVEDPGREVCPT